MANIPNFVRRRRKLDVMQFIPISKVFEPMIGVIGLKDVSGWADKDRKLKWSISTGQKVYLDKKTAREFEVKGYVRIVQGTVDPVSDDERAEILSSVTRISMGGTHG